MVGRTHLEVASPVASVLPPKTVIAAPRPAALDNQTVCLWWNSKSRGDVALTAVAEILERRFRHVTFVRFSQQYDHGRNFPERYAEAKRSGPVAAIATTGDWGNCSSWLAHDTVELERLGIPTVAIVSRRFVPLFEKQQQSLARQTFPKVVVESCLTELSPEQAREEIFRHEDEFIRALTAPMKVAPGSEQPPHEEEVLRYDGRDFMQAFDELNRDFLDRGWGDGFPVIPPTREAVEKMLGGSSRPRTELVAVMEPGMGLATVEKIAVNCVMAGCRPEHLPVVIAAVEAMTQPQFNLPLLSQSTGPHCPLLVINGPIRKELGINCTGCALGPGAPSRANTAIGRAIRLLMMNVGHVYANQLDMDTIGSPNKYSMCIGENEEANPWEPLHVERGFSRDASTVTAFSCTSFVDVADWRSFTPGELLASFAHNASRPTSTVWSWLFPRAPGWNRDNVILFAPDHARIIADAGWTKAEVRSYMFHNSLIPLRFVKPYLREPGKAPEWKWLLDEAEERLVQTVRGPESFHMLVVGAAGPKSAFVDGMGEPVTREIRQ